MTETPLNCFPMRADWGNTLPMLAAEPFPAPFVTSRDCEVEGWSNISIPSPVLKLAEFAREHSWEVRTQYSRGYIPHASTARPGALKDLIGLRFGAHPMTDRQAYAVYSRNASGSGTWTWSSVMIWGPDLPPFAGCGITELKTYLSMCGHGPTAEVLAFVSVVQEIQARKAAEVKARPKVPAKPRGDHA